MRFTLLTLVVILVLHSGVLSSYAQENASTNNLANYEAFKGLDDVLQRTPSQNQDRIQKFFDDPDSDDDFVGVVLSYEGLKVTDPFAGFLGTFRHSVMQPISLFGYGPDLAQVIDNSDPPGDLTENVYSQFTIPYEEKLKSAILTSEGGLTPADVIKLALKVAGGNYIVAVLTAHNYLKNVTWRGRHYCDDPGRRIQMPDEYARVASKLVNLRSTTQFGPGRGDKMGPWYHLFLPMLIGAMTTRYQASAAVKFEHFGRELTTLIQDTSGWSLGWSRKDPDKAAIDNAALDAMYKINSIIFYPRVILKKVYTTSDKETKTPKGSFMPGDPICVRMSYVFSEVEEGTPYVVEWKTYDSDNKPLAGLSRRREFEKEWDSTRWEPTRTIPEDAKAGTYTLVGKVKVGSSVDEKVYRFDVRIGGWKLVDIKYFKKPRLYHASVVANPLKMVAESGHLFYYLDWVHEIAWRVITTIQLDFRPLPDFISQDNLRLAIPVSLEASIRDFAPARVTRRSRGIFGMQFHCLKMTGPRTTWTFEAEGVPPNHDLQLSYEVSDGSPLKVSKTIYWNMGKGSRGDTIEARIAIDGNVGSRLVEVTYVYEWVGEEE